MRSERRKQIQAQLEAEKANNRRRGIFRVCRILSIIYVILAAALLGLLAWLDVLPAKYYWTAAGVLFVASLFIVPVMYSYRGKKGRKIAATLVALVMIGVFGVGTYYLANTVDFLDEITQVEEVTEDYHLLVKAETVYEDIYVLSGQTMGTYMSDDLRYSEAKAQLQREINAQYIYEENPSALIEKLKGGEYEAGLISAATWEVLKTQDPQLETALRILHTVKIKIETEENTSAADVTAESFNVYISGIDVEGSINTVSRSDVNMIATVNPVTNEVLLTSIPRDYYVTLPTKNAQDKLTHAGLYGIQETIGAVEGVMGIDINYYVRVNYTTIVKMVDALGGIEVDSPYEFTTSGMQHLNGHHFVKGLNSMDGNAALAFCRERKSFSNGDMQRNENQQLVMEAIIKKAVGSTAILTKYTSILDAVKGNMETNMSPEEMSALIRMQLDTMPGWDIQKQAIKGVNGWGPCYALGFSAATVEQVPEENARAVDKIIKVMTDGSEETDGTQTEES